MATTLVVRAAVSPLYFSGVRRPRRQRAPATRTPSLPACSHRQMSLHLPRGSYCLLAMPLIPACVAFVTSCTAQGWRGDAQAAASDAGAAGTTEVGQERRRQPHTTSNGQGAAGAVQEERSLAVEAPAGRADPGASTRATLHHACTSRAARVGMPKECQIKSLRSRPMRDKTLLRATPTRVLVVWCACVVVVVVLPCVLTRCRFHLVVPHSCQCSFL